MTAPRPLPPLTPLRWSCPRCACLTELRGGPTRLSALGVERERWCTACGGVYLTTEQIADRLGSLLVPMATPRWALALCSWIARVAVSHWMPLPEMPARMGEGR